MDCPQKKSLRLATNENKSMLSNSTCIFLPTIDWEVLRASLWLSLSLKKRQVLLFDESKALKQTSRKCAADVGKHPDMKWSVKSSRRESAGSALSTGHWGERFPVSPLQWGEGGRSTKERKAKQKRKRVKSGTKWVRQDGGKERKAHGAHHYPLQVQSHSK